MRAQNTSEQRRMVGRPWRKGQSGNPGGRPKEVRHVQDLARVHTVEAIETLVAIMRNADEPARARAAAAERILDRGWGRAPQAVEVTAKEPIIDTGLTEDELIERVMAKRRRARQCEDERAKRWQAEQARPMAQNGRY